MIRLAICGTGGMANHQVGQFMKIPDVSVVCACDVDRPKLTAFAEKHHIPRIFDSLTAMLDNGDFDAVSIIAPDAVHAPLSIEALSRKKHVLCEKPLATNYAEARKMADAAVEAGTVNMVNFSYRNSAALQQTSQLVRSGYLGRIFHVEAHYLQSWLNSGHWGDWRTSPGWLWRLSTAHGSKGVLGDIGVHILDFASMPVGEIESVNCLLKTFDKAPGGKIGEYILDANDTALITVSFRNGPVGSIATTRLATGHQNHLWLTIHGERGAIRIDLDRSYDEYELCMIGDNGLEGPWARVKAPATPSIYERFVESIRSGKNDQPDFARGATIQAALDACEKSNREGCTVTL